MSKHKDRGCSASSSSPSLSWARRVALIATLSCLPPCLPNARAEQGESSAAPVSPELVVEEENSAQGDDVLLLEAELFTGYRFEQTNEENFGEFEVDRGEIGLRSKPNAAIGGELRVELVRSAQRDSLLGIDGDSLVIRAKRAWGYARKKFGGIQLEGRAGLIPDPWIAQIQPLYDFRGLGPTLAESSQFYDTSDLGTGARAIVGDGLVEAQVAVTNGEGRNQREQNTGKNTTGVLRVRPLTWDYMGKPGSLNLLVGGREGSIGVGSARNHRLSAAALVESYDVSGGVEYHRAYGVNSITNRDSDAIGMWVGGRLRPVQSGAILRFDSLRQDVDLAESRANTLTAGLWTDLVADTGPLTNRLRIYLVGQDLRFGSMAGPIPGVPDALDSRRLMLLLTLRGSRGGF